jgi:hypothetical protein
MQGLLVVTDFSGQSICPILKGQAHSEGGIDRLSRNVGDQLPINTA